MLLTFIMSFLISGIIKSQDISLPAPQKTGGMPLMEALSTRMTSRAFSTRELSLQQLSDLLWAAFGINRPDGKRTAPSARNFQETDIYVLMQQGVYVYDPKSNKLVQKLAEDIRFMGGTQDFVKEAPVTLVYVADLAKMGQASTGDKLQTAYIDVGFISQNVYLYCASEGLATGARGMVDRTALGPKLSLGTDQAIIIAQSVGYPKE